MFHSGNVSSAARQHVQSLGTGAIFQESRSDGIAEELLNQQRQDSAEFFQQLLDTKPQRLPPNGQSPNSSGVSSLGVGLEHRTEHRMLQLQSSGVDMTTGVMLLSEDNEGSGMILTQNLSTVEGGKLTKSETSPLAPPPPKKPLSPYMRFSKAVSL